MTIYERALQKADELLKEDGTNPQLDALNKQKVQLQAQIAQLDKQREPLVLRLQDLNKRITQLGGVVAV
jgi:peptidoglycan hydrolase CwlO-like protein